MQKCACLFIHTGAMAELQQRWAATVAKLSDSDAQSRADGIRDGLLTHLELVKRRTITTKVGGKMRNV